MDLLRFGNWQDQAENLSRIFFFYRRSSRISSSAKNINSSAYKRLEIENAVLEIFMLLKIPASCSKQRTLDKTSVYRINRKGDSGSPCQRPLEGLKIST